MNIITDNKKDVSFANGVDVLSLFDGMACGMLAMQGAGLKVNNYYAYEIDKYAIKTVLHNFPEVQELGDVFDEDFSKYENIDFLMGGSPCTYWSIAQSPDKRETTASGLGWELFSQYVRAIKEAKPKYFIYENNKSMAKAIYESISETFGFEPIMINSALISAQNRQRYYWVGKRNEDGTYSKVDIEQPEDRGILLKDILDGNGYDLTSNDKSYTLTASYNGAVAWNTIERSQRNMVVEPVNITADGKAQCLRATCYKDGIRNLIANDVDRRTAVAEPVGTTKDGKSYCLTSGYSNGSGENIGNYVAHTLEKGCKSMVAEPVNTTVDGKSYCLTSSYYKASANPFSNFGEEIRRPRVAEPVGLAQRGRYGENGIEQHYEVREDGKSNCLTTVQKDTLVGEPVNSSVQVGALPRPNGELSKSQAFRIYDVNAKSVTLKAGGGGAGGKTGLYAIPVEFDGDIPTKAISCVDGKTYKVHEVKDGLITIKEKQYPIKLQDGYYIIRKLTVSECKRLQTVPEWYEFPVSDTQGYKMLGNGWCVDVIVHLIKSILR